MTDETKSEPAISRRTLLKAGAATAGLAAGSGLITGFPMVWSQEIKNIVVRQLGSSGDTNKFIEDAANKDLPFKVQMTAVDGSTVIARALTQPDTFDVLSDGTADLAIFWNAGTLQPIEKKRLKWWDKVSPIFSQGSLPGGKMGQGANPFLTINADGATPKSAMVGKATDYLVGAPALHNADTLGVRPDLIDAPVTSWADLLRPSFKGKAALCAYPSVGLIDAACAFEAAGQLKYVNKGDMTRQEIDATIAALTDLKSQGHFRAFWGAYEESVNLMVAGETVVQSMWAPAVYDVRAQGVPCTFQNLKEGYRCWAVALYMNAKADGMLKDAIYDYLNWYHEAGKVGASWTRQGYYSAAPETVRSQLTPAEWDYFMAGKPAPTDILDANGHVIEKKGGIRTGGSYEQRLSNPDVWNTIMKENQYEISAWNDFMAS